MPDGDARRGQGGALDNAGMEVWLSTQLAALLHWLSLPANGLGTVFVVAFVSATLLPMGSEPAVFALVKLRPDLFWPAIAVATLGNTLGGVLSWWMGWAAHRAWAHARAEPRVEPQAEPQADARADPRPDPQARRSAADARALRWLQRFGPAACVLSWLPLVGDPLCAVAGWLRLPFWPCAGWMALGKLGRYVCATALLVWAF